MIRPVRVRWIAESLAEQAFGRRSIAQRRQQEVDSGTGGIDGPIEVTPTALHSNIRLIETPGFVGRLEMTAQPLLQFGTVTLNPTPDRRVIHLQTAFGEQLFDIAERERVPKIPAHGTKNQLRCRLPQLEDCRSGYVLHGLFRLPATPAKVATHPGEAAGARGSLYRMPCPLRLTTCGVLAALSLTFRVPVMTPVTDGANLTAILHLFPGKRGEVQVLVWVNPAVVEMLARLSEAVPLFFRVTAFAALLVPTVRLPKLKLVGLTVPIGTCVGVAVGVAVRVADAVGVAVPVGVAVAVLVAVAVGVAVLVAVAVDVPVAVAVGVAVRVADAVGVAVPAGVAVALLAAVAVGVAVLVAVAVDVPVAVAVAVVAAVAVAVGVGEGPPLPPNAITLAE